MNILFATHNSHKADEIRARLPEGFRIITLHEAGFDRDIPEPYPTLEENAREKCHVIHQATGLDCFAEDTGLEIDALGGRPGVRSARYAGEHRSDTDNMARVLSEMSAFADRTARFRTVIALKFQGKDIMFEGICTGSILNRPRGNAGFGYDPIFAPSGSDRSFAEMSLKEKAAISHRGKAVEQLIRFFQDQTKKEKI